MVCSTWQEVSKSLVSVFCPKKMKSSVGFLQVIGDLQRQKGVWWGSYCKSLWQIQSYVNTQTDPNGSSCSSLSLNFDLFWEEFPRNKNVTTGNLTGSIHNHHTTSTWPWTAGSSESRPLKQQNGSGGLLWRRIPNGFIENPGTTWVFPSVVGHHLMATRLSVRSLTCLK